MVTSLAFTWSWNSCCYSTCITSEKKVQQRRKYNKAILTGIYKCLNNQLEGLHPNYLRHSEIYRYDAKNKDNFLLPKPRTENMKHIYHFVEFLIQKYSKLWFCIKLQKAN